MIHEDWEREHFKERIFLREQEFDILNEIIKEELIAKNAGSVKEIRKFTINTRYATRKRPRILKYVARHSPHQPIVRPS